VLRQGSAAQYAILTKLAVDVRPYDGWLSCDGNGLRARCLAVGLLVPAQRWSLRRPGDLTSQPAATDTSELSTEAQTVAEELAWYGSTSDRRSTSTTYALFGGYSMGNSAFPSGARFGCPTHADGVETVRRCRPSKARPALELGCACVLGEFLEALSKVLAARVRRVAAAPGERSSIAPISRAS